MKNKTSAKNKELSYKKEYYTRGIAYDIDHDEKDALSQELTAKSLVRDVYRGIYKGLSEHGFTAFVFEKTKGQKKEANERILRSHRCYWMYVEYMLDTTHYLYKAFEPTIIITCNKKMVDKIKSIVKQESAFYNMLYDEDVSILIRSVNISNPSV